MVIGETHTRQNICAAGILVLPVKQANGGIFVSLCACKSVGKVTLLCSSVAAPGLPSSSQIRLPHLFSPTHTEHLLTHKIALVSEDGAR